MIGSAFVLGIGCLWQFSQVGMADISPSIPSVVQKGLRLYESGGPEPAFDTWRHGGLLDGAGRTETDVRNFKEMVSPIGNYVSCDLIESREIGRTSRIVYLSMNFERGVVYASFLVYNAQKDWVVQKMDFNTKPETIMPWLALEGPK
jgi:hypothetical protein